MSAWTTKELIRQHLEDSVQIVKLEADVARLRSALEHYAVIADHDGALGRDRREIAREALVNTGAPLILDIVKAAKAMQTEYQKVPQSARRMLSDNEQNLFEAVTKYDEVQK